MKTKLPKRSEHIKNRLDQIVEQVLIAANNKIAMIILYGSYARGDWVEDEYIEYNRPISYQSDLDIMLVFKKGSDAGYPSRDIINKIEKRLDRYIIPHTYPALIRGKPSASFEFESINSFNKQLDLGRYYFTDVRDEGIMLYDSGEFKLAESRKLSWEEFKPIAQFDYNEWFPNGKEFLIDCRNCIARKNYKKAAFELHQATEGFYNAISLVFAGYKGKEHDLKKLKGNTSQYSEELLKIFPITTKEQKENFKLLRDAYVGARYDRNYVITLDQLNYLIGQVEKLRDITENICLERLGK